MKILFVSMISFENNTSATIQNKGILKGLVQLGHTVDVITLRPNINNGSYDKTICYDMDGMISNSYYIDINPMYAATMAKKQNTITTNQKDNSLGTSAKKLLKSCRNLIKKIYDSTSIFDALKINVKRVSKLNIDYNQYDIIISASDPKSSHLIVKEIYRKNAISKPKWIQYWGDPMYIDITRKCNWRDILVKYNEKKLIDMADRVVYASPLTLKVQRSIFSKYACKMDYSNQSYINVDYNKDKKFKKSGDIIVGYYGSYASKVRDIMPLYNSAKGQNFILNICGTSDINLQATENVHIKGMLPYKETVNLEMESDILVCICNSGGTQIPGKIYYSASYMKPIIIILDGEYKEELRKYFSEFNRYILCENEEKSILNAINIAREQLKNKDFSLAEAITPKFVAKKVLGELEK